jgi:hypothetical protein
MIDHHNHLSDSMIPLQTNLKKDIDYKLLPISLSRRTHQMKLSTMKITITIICDDLIELLSINYELFIVNFLSGKFLDQRVQNFAFNIHYLLKKYLRNIPF